MISYKSQIQLARYFKTLSLNIQKIETLKQMIYQSPFYDSYSLFKKIDQNAKGFFNIKDIINFLNKHSNQIIRQYSYNLFQYLDYQQIGRISFTQFEKFLTPFDVYNKYKNNHRISDKYEIEYILFDIFSLIMDNFEYQNETLHELQQQIDFSITNAFNHLDKYNQNCLEMKNFKEFQIQHDFNLNYYQLSLLFHFVHQNQDKFIFLEHFQNFFYQEYSDFIQKSYSPSVNQLSAKKISQELKLSYNEDYFKKKTIHQPIQSYFSQKKNQEYSQYLEKSVEKNIEYSQYLEKSAEKNNSVFFKTQHKKSKEQKQIKTAKKTSFRNFEKQEFIESLKEIIYNERKIEEQKQILASQKDLNIFDIFRIFDYNCEERINQYQFLDVLESFGLFYDYSTLNNLFNQLDIQNNGYLQLNEFLQLVVPNAKEFQYLLKSKQPIFVKEFEDFSLKTREILISLFEMQIENVNKTEKIRQRLNQKVSFDYLFKYVDIDEKGFITKDDFRSFLIKNKFYPTQNDLKSLVQTFDRTQNGKISFKEFYLQLQPQKI